MHPREQVIRSMARTLVVTSFADWCDEEEQRGKEIPGRAGPQQNWMNTAPEMSAACREAALIEAAVLYGRIKQAWFAEPWILVQRYTDHAQFNTMGKRDGDKDLCTWGHYAVMSCLGHGVCWEDDHAKLEDTYVTFDLHRNAPHTENLDWEWEKEVIVLRRLDTHVDDLGLPTKTLSALYNRFSEYTTGVGWRVVTVGELLPLSRNDLLRVKNIGRKGADAILAALEPYRRA